MSRDQRRLATTIYGDKIDCEDDCNLFPGLPVIKGVANLTITTKEGETVFLPCEIKEDSQAEIIWTHNGLALR